MDARFITLSYQESFDLVDEAVYDEVDSTYRHGVLNTYVVPKDGKFYEFSVRIHHTDGWENFDDVEAVEVQKITTVVERWVAVTDVTEAVQTTASLTFEDLEGLQKQFTIQAQHVFKQITKDFFEKNPAINAIKWAQYENYFNDGDPCYFSVYDPMFTNAAGDDLDDVSNDEYNGDNNDVFVIGLYDAKIGTTLSTGIDVESIDKFSTVLCSDVMCSIMETMFGDSVQVTATRDGFDVTEYDHD